MASKNKKAGANHFALLETDDPGDARVEKPAEDTPASLTEQLFGRAYPSAWEIMRNRRRQQYSAPPPPPNAKAARADGKKGAQGQGSGARKQQGGRYGNGAAVNDDGAPAPRLYDPAEFPSLK